MSEAIIVTMRASDAEELRIADAIGRIQGIKDSKMLNYDLGRWQFEVDTGDDLNDRRWAKKVSKMVELFNGVAKAAPVTYGNEEASGDD